VQDVIVRDLLIGIEVEPPLAAFFPGPGVPADAQCLVAPARELDQVLLKRRDAEGVADGIVMQLAVRAVRAHEEPAVPLEEGGGHAAMREGRVVEVAQDGLVGGLLHGEVVMRSRPEIVLLPMALDTGRPPHVGERFAEPDGCEGLRGRVLLLAGAAGAEEDEAEDRNDTRNGSHMEDRSGADHPDPGTSIANLVDLYDVWGE
jgi:hypothetical protein